MTSISLIPDPIGEYDFGCQSVGSELWVIVQLPYRDARRKLERLLVEAQRRSTLGLVGEGMYYKGRAEELKKRIIEFDENEAML